MIAYGYNGDRLIDGRVQDIPEDSLLVEGCGWTFKVPPPANESNEGCVLAFIQGDWRILPWDVKPKEPEVL